jgi:hypothetical protein
MKLREFDAGPGGDTAQRQPGEIFVTLKFRGIKEPQAQLLRTISAMQL